MKPSLDVNSLSRIIDLSDIPVNHTDLEEQDVIIGQPRAVKALETGLNIKRFGYNIFVSGAPGTGKLTAVKRFISKRAKQEASPSDWCYVNNFKDPYRPMKISLPAGQAKHFRNDIKRLIEEAQDSLRKTFNSEEFSKHKNDIINRMNELVEKLFSKVSNEAAKENMAIRSTPMGIFIIPLKNGKTMNAHEVEELKEKEVTYIREVQEKLNKKLDEYLSDKRKTEKAAQDDIEKLEKDAALFAIDTLIKERKAKYYNLPDILSYLDAVKEDILNNIPLFLDGTAPKNQIAAMLGDDNNRDAVFAKYDVNVLIDNSDVEGAPLVIETNPTYVNLIGKMEKEARFGTLTTNFNLIKSGALHKANGGYLVIDALEMLRNPLSYESLKRCLKSGHIEIEEASDALGLMSSKTLKPEPIPLDIKVIIIGESQIYHLLYNYDNEFREIFKIKADFNSAMEINNDTIKDYNSFIKSISKKESLRPMDNSAFERILQYGCRLTENQDKLSTQFGKIADIIRESSYYAELESSNNIMAEHVSHAIEEKLYRSNLLQEKLEEMITEGSISIEVEGEKTGQVNGLSVIDIGDISFGHPNKITVSTGVGRDGIIDIEREAKLGGPLHTKGVMIISGYLNEEFARKSPVSVSARLVFEQSYGGVEGDSASSTELYAILSSLAGLPIKQGIAVTGSVNQKGEVQAVGGINEKIEGYFEVCKLKGFSGHQGVIIPEHNIKHLMLKEEVLKAVEENKFKIWAVNSIDEGIEILTGVKAGTLNQEDEFEKGTVKYRVQQRLREISGRLRELSISTVDGKSRIGEPLV